MSIANLGLLGRDQFVVLVGPAMVLVVMMLNFGLVMAYIRAHTSRTKVKFAELVALRLRGVPVGLVVDDLITAHATGLELSIDDLSTHYLAGGNVETVVLALIAARQAGVHLVYDRACAIDLATKGTGRSLLEAVRNAVKPRVIDCPDPSLGQTWIECKTLDGVQIKAKARVTLRTQLDRFVGGAKEDKLIAHISDCIIGEISAADSHREVLKCPDRISKAVMEKGLDRNTAFEIMAVDITLQMV